MTSSTVRDTAPVGGGHTRIADHAVLAGVLLAVAAFVYGRVLEMRPLGGDNLYILGWADRNPIAALLGVDPDFYPEWRPLAYLSVWLQYRWSGLDDVRVYYLVNVLLWTSVAWLVSLVVLRLTSSTLAGLFSAAVVLVDPRPVFAVAWIIERQSSLACLFGLLALLLVLGPRKSRPSALRWVVVSLLLLASALSKEFGLAFAGAVAVWAFQREGRERRRGAAVAAVAAVAVYVALRLWLANGAMAPVCDQMGYFFQLRTLCFARPDATMAAQAVYNVVAAGVNSLLPGLLLDTGQMGVTPALLVIGAVFGAAALLGWARGPAFAGVTLPLIAVNALLNFTRFRDRNQVVALCAVGIAVGAGVVVLGDLLRSRSARTRLAVGALLAGTLAAQAVRTRHVMSSVVESSFTQEACESLQDFPHLDPSFVSRVKTKYGMANPTCDGWPLAPQAHP